MSHSVLHVLTRLVRMVWSRDLIVIGVRQYVLRGDDLDIVRYTC
jgi:hypothetical protein